MNTLSQTPGTTTNLRRKAHASQSPPRTRRTHKLHDDETSITAAVTAQKEARRRPSFPSIPVLQYKSNTEEPSQGFGGGGDNDLSRNVLMGLNVAGVAQALLTTMFRLFHVNVFLQSYKLPLESYSNGSFVVSIITTVTSVVGSWMVDATATQRDRTESVGQAGFYFVACFLTPFFGYHPHGGTLHFIVTVSLYQTLYSYTAILLGSIVTDSHNMTQQKRVQFMASGKAVNLVMSFVVARVALMTFSQDDLRPFRIFLAILAGIVLFLFALAHSMIHGTYLWRYLRSFRHLTFIKTVLSAFRRKDAHDTTSPDNDEEGSVSSAQSSERRKKRLQWRRIVRDFVTHHNFRVWVVMELLLHSQITFNSNFLKTFVDNLLVEEFGRDMSDWLLSLMPPLTQFVTIVAYIPIQKWGYPRVYLILFLSNFVLSNIMLWFVGSSSSYGILSFLMVYFVSTRAVQSAGFHLALADMVLEMKRNHAKQGRSDEPSMAGLFMGANALLCVSTRLDFRIGDKVIFLTCLLLSFCRNLAKQYFPWWPQTLWKSMDLLGRVSFICLCFRQWHVQCYRRLRGRALT